MAALGAVSSYAAVHSRVRVMYGNLLSRDDWDHLSSITDAGALIEALKGTVYGAYINRVKAEDLTTRRVEYEMHKYLADAFGVVIKHIPDHARALMIQLYRLYEVDNLKATLRGLVLRESWEQIRYTLFPYGNSTVLPAKAITESGTVEEAVALLQGTPYYHTLVHALERYEKEQNLFPLEVALDLDYWRELWRLLNRLSLSDRQPTMPMIGGLLDICNLIWALRYRIYYHLSEEEIINYTLPFGYKIHDEQIQAIAAGEDIVRIIKEACPDLPHPDELLQDPLRGLPKLELWMQQKVYEACHSAMLGYPFHFGVPLAFLLLTEYEIQDLTVLLEAASLQIPIDRYKRFRVSALPMGLTV